MFLKRIEVKGFKSFADRVGLEINKGITAVVGPNGSGKSNISDAVRWVLGEQSARSLRGSKMEDVIFSGTASRKPLGFAEVSITLDNTDEMLSVDYSEVTVTRRMFRSGESEYYINGTACRLKDITELFMDTGIGRDGYSIIGQGRVEEILNAKPEDRREIFEEAAGIVKYRTRKLEAERRLESTEQNITRIEDIVNELESQIGPLSEQSEKAKKYLNFREKLKILELNIFIRNVEKLKEKIAAADENLSSLEEELLDNNRKSARIEDDCSRIKSKITESEALIEELQSDVQTSSSQIEKLQGEVNVCNEKITNINNTTIRLNEEIDLENAKIDELNCMIDTNNKSLIEHKGLISTQSSILNEQIERLDEINSNISDKENHIESMKSEVIEILNSISEKKSNINGLLAFKNNIEKRKSQIETERKEKLLKTEDLKKDLLSCEEEIKSLRERYSALEKNIKEYENYKIELTGTKKALEKNIFELNGKIQSRKARHKVLNEMESEFEGYNRSVKEIMKLKDGSMLTGSGAFAGGICGVVADLIKTDKRYEVSIEVALGPALQNIVTEDEYAAKSCIEFLKERKYGRATFLPLTTISGRGTPQNESKIRSCRGFIGFASELVSCDIKYKNIISSLLGRVIIIDNMDNAIVMAKSINYSMKIVTLEGDVLNPGGSFTGGSLGHKTSSILGRKREIEELEKNLAESTNTLSIMNEELVNTDNKLRRLEDDINKALNERRELDKLLSSSENKRDIAVSEKSRLEQELDSLSNESLQLDSEFTEIESKMDMENKSLDELVQNNDRLSAIIQEEQSGIKGITQTRDSIQSEITSVKIKIAELKQAASSLEGRISELKSDIEKCSLAIAEKEAEKEKAGMEKAHIENEILNIKAAISSAVRKNETSRKKLEDIYEEKKKASDVLEDMEKKIKEYSLSSGALQGEIHKIEINKAKLDMEMENIQNRIWEEYEVSFASAQKYRTEIESVSQVNRDISSLKESIKELGTVNVGAIEEYKNVKETYDFLIGQGADLREAKESLEKVIAEITEKMKSQFVKNFAVINENFNFTFHKLFGGGRAELILVDSDNVLESGVDIVAEPPGKKLQSLTLLSGGEKALTAIALLFAILKMKPSPFCILDEIEAALDDINVVRFANFLRELSSDTQFIVVTHRKGTMEAADVLYGVTMEEKGVSKLVSVKLTERAS